MRKNNVCATVPGENNECYQDSDEDEDSANLEVDGFHPLPEFDLSALDEARHGTTVVNMRDSMNVEIKPATHIHGTVTINQYVNGNSSSQNFSQLGLEAPFQKGLQNSNGSVNREEPNLHVPLRTTGQKLDHFLRSSISCKLGLTFAAISAALICIVIVYFTVLKHNTSGDIPIPTPPPEEGNSDLGQEVHIIRRSRWGGRPIRDGYQNRTLDHPIGLVIIGHTAGHNCTTVEECSTILQTIQAMHVEKGWVDVGYNYLIGGDGNIYETLAWNFRNYIRGNSTMISFFGNYEFDNVQDVQILALRLLLDQGIELGKLDPNYRLVAHSQVANTISPGTNLKKVIQRLPHYYNGIYT